MAPTGYAQDYIDPDWLLDASPLEQDFAAAWMHHFPEIDLYTEYEFAKSEGRKYRHDFVHWESKTAIECQGFRDHTSRKGFQRDANKHRLAGALGWQVIAVTTQDLADDESTERTLGEIVETIQRRLSATG